MNCKVAHTNERHDWTISAVTQLNALIIEALRPLSYGKRVYLINQSRFVRGCNGRSHGRAKRALCRTLSCS